MPSILVGVGSKVQVGVNLNNRSKGILMPPANGVTDYRKELMRRNRNGKASNYIS